MLAVALIAACEGSSGAPTAPRIDTTAFAPSLGVVLSSSTKTASGMYYRDLAVGAGTTVASGMALTVRYTGWLPDGSQFDANQSQTSPFAFTIGAGKVIAGWDEGLIGAKVGGRRQLIIPPALGYGSSANGQIPANSILVFNVDIVSAR